MLASTPPWLWLAGCPYVFGPPDLSNVPGSSTAGGTLDTDPTPVPTGDTGPIVVGPAIVELQLLPFAGGLRVYATFTPAGALDGGGALLVGVDGTAHEAAVPGEADLVGGDLVSWTVPIADACDGITIEALSASLRDAAGVVGEPVVTPYAIAGLGTVPDSDAVVELGLVAFPVLWCGAADQPGELDGYRLSFDRDAEAAIALSWPDQADLDVLLRENGSPATGGYDAYLPPPELAYWPLTTNAAYEVRIQHWAGLGPVPWMLVFADAP